MATVRNVAQFEMCNMAFELELLVWLVKKAVVKFSHLTLATSASQWA
jgi:hypothetical protein